MSRAGRARAWVAALLLALSARDASAQRTLFVAAASDLRFALDELAADFQKRQPDVAVKVSYGSSGNFYAQLQQKAPFDVFLSADADYPRRLDAEGLALLDSLFPYAVGRLALWAPRAGGVDVAALGMKALLLPGVKKVAIANPRHAPYGRAAEAALRNLDLYEQVQPKLVLGENVAQAAQFAQTGAADAALIAYALVLAPSLQTDGRYFEVPLDAYPRLEQAGVILKWARDVSAARAFSAYLLSPEGRAILKRWGFLAPAD